MRARFLAAVVAFLIIVSPPAADVWNPVRVATAHEGGVDHGAVFNGTLAAQASVTRHLDFEGGQPLVGGWVFLLGARVEGELVARLTVGASVAKEWTIAPGGTQIRTTILPETGVYDLTLENPGAADVRYWAYFDQSCRCIGKFVPAEIPDGYVIFNTDTTGPSTVFAQLNDPPAMDVKVSAALLTGQEGVWPSDFQILAVSATPVQRTVRDITVWLHELRFDVGTATTVYFFVQGVAFHGDLNTPKGQLAISPYYEVTEKADLSPFLYVGIAGAFLIAGILILRRVRASPAPRPIKKTEVRRPSATKVNRRGGGRGGSRTRKSQRSRRRT
ncbi:MAG: hypothetical protein HY557_00135 [Euryarchaeota archaeon]|nr:hypothetical protein [Euryarchaeota archaeon]